MQPAMPITAYADMATYLYKYVNGTNHTLTRRDPVLLPYNPRYVNPFGCQGIIKGDGLYIQCTGTPLGTTQWCYECSKGVSIYGRPIHGCVADRNRCPLNEYVGGDGTKVRPYVDYVRDRRLTAQHIMAKLEQEGYTADRLGNLSLQQLPQKSNRGRPPLPKEPEVNAQKLLWEFINY
jgi:hypothetical protein